MTIIIQSIRTDWTKKSRGHPHATPRNRVPEKLDLDLPDREGGIWLSDIQFHEFSNFQHSKKKALKAINDQELRDRGIVIRCEGELLQLTSWIRNRHGKRLPLIPPNNWIQILSNERYSMEYTWGYYKQVLNICYGESRKLAQILNTKACLHRIDKQSRMW
ncbi:MAG: hypothetical protein AAF587_29840 [Bacteroidota bacterium]